MDIQLRRWGNSLGLRIPHQLAISLNLDETTTLELIEVNDTLILRKKTSPPTLKAILESIPENFEYPSDAEEFVNSAPVGQELI